jgi:hypothetical protein
MEVCFTPGRFAPGGRALQYPLNRKVGLSQSWSGRRGEEVNILSPHGMECRFLDCPARGLITIPTDKYFHSPYVIMAWCLVKHRGNFMFFTCMYFNGVDIFARLTVLIKSIKLVRELIILLISCNVRIKPASVQRTGWMIIRADVHLRLIKDLSSFG